MGPSYTPHPRSRSQNPGLGSTSRVGSSSRSESPVFIFRDFLGDHFAPIESSGNLNLTMFILDFHIFSQLLLPKKVMKFKVSYLPSNSCPLGPSPDDRAQKVVPIALNESSVRPNPTPFFSKIRFQCWLLVPLQYRPKPLHKSNQIQPEEA